MDSAVTATRVIGIICDAATDAHANQLSAVVRALSFVQLRAWRDHIRADPRVTHVIALAWSRMCEWYSARMSHLYMTPPWREANIRHQRGWSGMDSALARHQAREMDDYQINRYSNRDGFDTVSAIGTITDLMRVMITLGRAPIVARAAAQFAEMFAKDKPRRDARMAALVAHFDRERDDAHPHRETDLLIEFARMLAGICLIEPMPDDDADAAVALAAADMLDSTRADDFYRAITRRDVDQSGNHARHLIAAMRVAIDANAFMRDFADDKWRNGARDRVGAIAIRVSIVTAHEDEYRDVILRAAREIFDAPHHMTALERALDRNHTATSYKMRVMVILGLRALARDGLHNADTGVVGGCAPYNELCDKIAQLATVARANLSHDELPNLIVATMDADVLRAARAAAPHDMRAYAIARAAAAAHTVASTPPFILTRTPAARARLRDFFAQLRAETRTLPAGDFAWYSAKWRDAYRSMLYSARFID